MDEGSRIFASYESGRWMTYDIETDEEGVRRLLFGEYIYDSEGDEEAPWRCVSEDVVFTLDQWVHFIEEGLDPQEDEAYLTRSCDYIEDITEAEAYKEFVETFNHTPKLDMEYVTKDTPDGRYIGRYAGMRRH